MTAADTNILVRILANDDVDQARRAADLFREGPVRVSKTVLLETEWVLRFTYSVKREAIARAFDGLLALGNVEVEDRSGVLRALHWYHDGLDFADALHLASVGTASTFVTFDRDLARRSKRQPGAPVVTIPRE